MGFFFDNSSSKKKKRAGTNADSERVWECVSELLNLKRRKSNKCEGKQLFAPIFSLASCSDPSGGRHRHVAANLYTLLRETGMHSLHFGRLLRLLNRSKMPKCCGAKMYAKVHTHFFLSMPDLQSFVVQFPSLVQTGAEQTERALCDADDSVSNAFLSGSCITFLTHGAWLHAGKKKLEHSLLFLLCFFLLHLFVSQM